jgi:hypothetical protein
MPRIIVTTDPVSPNLSDDAAVLLDEHVHSVHLSTDHAAAQLVERLAWAVSDAERAERAHPLPQRRTSQRQPTRIRRAVPYTQHAISA